jgi:pyruvyl transferase EpsO
LVQKMHFKASENQMESIKAELAVINKVIPSHSQIVYVDFPVYENIGDLLIMKGTEQFFKDYQIIVEKRFSIANFRFKQQIPPNWIIVCQGGGNFGDLYPHFQSFREKIAVTYPNHRIVILPQTIHFQSEIKERQSMQLLNEHADLHLFVRDQFSYNRAKLYLKHVQLSPDMAHQLYPLQKPLGGSKKVIGLFRTDDEWAEGMGSFQCDKTMDWPQLLNLWDVATIRLMVKAFQVNRLCGNIMPLQRIWYIIADRLITKAIHLYNDFGQVVTSRLHGHILACLLDKTNVLLDNSYGKNSSYYQAWTYALPQATFAINEDLEGDEHASSSRPNHSDLYTQSSG